MSTTGDTGRKEEMVMEHLVSLSYRERLTPNLNRFVDRILEGELVGHRCPSCSRVYIPPKGYCPLCVVTTSAEDEVQVSDHGILTGFTIVTPVAYYGQQATDPFVYASVLLNGAHTPIGGQDITGVAHDRIHTGMRVRAVWRPREERKVEGITNRGWGGLDAIISSFEVTGEPDAGPEEYREHLF